AVEFGDEVIGLDDRRLERIGRADPDIAAALGALLPGGDRHAGFVFELTLDAFLVAGGREGHLQVRAFGGLAGMPEAVDHGRRQREQAAPGRRPFERLDPEMPALPQLVDGLDVLDPRHRARRVVILQPLADARQRMAHFDAVRAQQLRRTDPRKLQQLRRIVAAAREDHFLAGANLHRRAAPAALDVAHADRALAFKDDLRGVRMRTNMDIAALARGMQESLCCAAAKAVLDRALGVRDAFLDCAVVIGIARDAEADGARHEGLAQRILPVHGGDGETALAPAIFVIALADAALQSFEIGQHVRIAPAAIAELCPGIEIQTLAAIEDVAVDRGRAAERLAARRVDAAATRPGAHFLLIRPVDAAHMEGLDEAGGQMNVGMPIARARFQHADAHRRIFAEPVGQYAAGRACANNYIIESIHAVLLLARQARPCPTLPWRGRVDC